MAITVDRERTVTVTASDVAWTRRYGTFVKGGNVGLDAQVDSIVPKAMVRSRIAVQGFIDEEHAYPLASEAAYVVGVVARKTLMHRKLTRGSIAGRAQSEGRCLNLRVSESVQWFVVEKKRP